MFLNVLNYILEILRKSPALRPIVALIRLVKIKLRRGIRDRPYLAVTAIVAVALFIAFNPKYSPYLPSPICGYIKLEDGQLYSKAGNELVLGGERSCEPLQVQALEFFNLSNVDLEQKNKFVPAVSAGLFVKETARRVNMQNQWHEYTLFTESNNFIWAPADPENDTRVEQFSFNKGECRNDRSYENQMVETEIREGIVLRSDQFRSDPSLPYETWKKCNYGAPGKVGFEECKYFILEFFLPIGTPKQKCPLKGAGDIWLGIGTKKAILADLASYNILTDLAADRWDKQRIAPVSEGLYKRLTAGLPKICMRWRADGKEAGDWNEFATIPAVWCDL